MKQVRRGAGHCPVRWPVLYRSEQFVAEGTVLDVTPIGWRIGGAMPVVPGMELTLDISVPGQTDPIHIEQAAVLWVKGCEFALEPPELSAGDRAVVAAALNRRREPSSLSGPADPLRRRQAQVGREGKPADMWDIEDEVVRRCIIAHGCEEPVAREAYRRFMQDVWNPARRLVRSMAAKKAARERAGRDFILDN